MGVEFKRKKDVEHLLSKKGNGKIKVIEGLRQVGKSYLLRNLFFDELIKEGVRKENIKLLDFVGNEYDIRGENTLLKISLLIHYINEAFASQL